MCVCVCVCVRARARARAYEHGTHMNTGHGTRDAYEHGVRDAYEHVFYISILLSIIGFKTNNKKTKRHFNIRTKWSTVLFLRHCLRFIMIFPLLRYTSYTEFTIKKKFNL